MTASLEVGLIERLAAALPRSPRQVNARHESDAELVRLADGLLLAVTTDGIVEEIESGLYADPDLIGWMTVAVNASDLAAVGASPLGILVCETLPRDADEMFLERLQRGLAAAADAHRLPVLGGDTNISDHLALAGTALGLVPDGSQLTRRGAAPGDLLFASGPLGLGSAFAFARLQAGSGPAPQYRPRARLAEGELLRGLASACMDTSDGVLPVLDELGRLNDVGFRLTLPWQAMLHPAALRLVCATQLPPWMMLAGPHGEFELLFAVPGERVERLHREAAARGWAPLELGEVCAEPGVELCSDGGPCRLDAGKVRNLFTEVGGNVAHYIEGLFALSR